jgi:hypothetical protein
MGWVAVATMARSCFGGRLDRGLTVCVSHVSAEMQFPRVVVSGNALRDGDANGVGTDYGYDAKGI